MACVLLTYHRTPTVAHCFVQVGRDIVASFSDVGIAATVKTVTAVDVWSGKVTHGVTSPITATAVAAHGVTFLTLTPE